MNINKTNENNSNQSVGVTVTPNINEWVKEVHVHHSVIVDADKKKDHWRKRELDAALVCGENLLKIRQQYGKKGTGFKTFIIAEFSSEFSYVTCRRYIRLHLRRAEIGGICGIRRAFVKLGIMKETFNYPKATPTVNGTVLPTGSSAKKRKVAACSSPNCNSKTIVDMLPHSNSIVLTFLENKVSSTNTHNVFELKVDDNCQMMYRTAATESDFRILDSRSFETLSKRLKPFVDWYNKANTTPTVVQNFMASNESMVLAG